MSILRRLFKKERMKEPENPAETVGPTNLRAEEFNFQGFQDLSPQEAAEMISRSELQVLDVRFEYEYLSHHIPQATLIPLPQLSQRYTELDSSKPTLVLCEHGMRSLNACSFLSQNGFRKLYNMVGGMSVYPGKMEGTSVSS